MKSWGPCYTLAGLWARYREARARLEGGGMTAGERGAVERQARGLRDRLVANYSPLVKYVAGRVVSRAVYPLEGEEIFSWGLLGLAEAVETYDPGRRAKFETYAISKIRWSVLDELRKADPLPRRARSRARQAERARGELAQRLGRSPTEAEVAREVGVGLDEHRALLEQCSRAHVGSLEASMEPGGGPGGAGGDLYEVVADGAAVDPEKCAEEAEVRARLVEAIRSLGEQERVVATFYFYEGLTLREIGGSLNLTEGRISQILRRAVTKLRESLSESPQLSGML